MDDHPTTSTRVIQLSHDFSATPTEHPEDRNDAAGRRRAQGTIRRRGQPESSSPDDAALRALVKLLARQVAEEHVSQECRR